MPGDIPLHHEVMPQRRTWVTNGSLSDSPVIAMTPWSNFYSKMSNMYSISWYYEQRQSPGATHFLHLDPPGEPSS